MAKQPKSEITVNVAKLPEKKKRSAESSRQAAETRRIRKEAAVEKAMKSCSCANCEYEYPQYANDGTFVQLGCMYHLGVNPHGDLCDGYILGESKYKRAVRRWLELNGVAPTDKWVTPKEIVVSFIEHIRQEAENNFKNPTKRSRKSDRGPIVFTKPYAKRGRKKSRNV